VKNISKIRQEKTSCNFLLATLENLLNFSSSSKKISRKLFKSWKLSKIGIKGNIYATILCLAGRVCLMILILANNFKIFVIFFFRKKIQINLAHPLQKLPLKMPKCRPTRKKSICNAL